MWSYNRRLRKQVFVPIADTPAAPSTIGGLGSTPLVTSSDHTFTSDDALTLGHWVQSTGVASMRNGSVTEWSHDLDASHAYPHLTLATDFPCGVCKNNEGQIIHSGMVMAWVVQPDKRRLELDGLYSMYVNGVQVHDVVIMRASPHSRSFIICATKDDATLQLRRRLDALTI